MNRENRGKSTGRLRKINLQTDFVYGPVSSRRLGKSLGINPIAPGTKVCTFNCVYCQYEARSPVNPANGIDLGRFGDFETIVRLLADRMSELKEEGEHLDYITFAGNGEPTLHPDFPSLVEITIKLRDSLHQSAGTAILTNGSTLVERRIVDAVKSLDKAIVKLDAATLPVLRKVNRPYKGFDLEAFIESLSELDNLVIQALFLDGRLTNAGDCVREWIEAMGRVKPREIQIYSLDRAPAVEDILPLSVERLEDIARRLEDETGLHAEVF